MRTYFITGISGFLGRNLVLELLKNEGVKIIGLVMPNEENLDFFYEHEEIELVRGNILNSKDLDQFLTRNSEGEKIIIHAAGMITTFRNHDKKVMDINYEGTMNIVGSAIKNGCDKFIYISSVDALDKRKGTDPIFEQETYNVEKVDGVYSKSKVLATNYVLEKTREGKLNGIIVMPSAMIGRNDPANNPINAAIIKFMKGKLNVLLKGQYNICDVEDVAKGIVDCSSKGRVGESYILSGEQIKIIDLMNKVADINGQKRVKTLVPIPLVKLGALFIELHARIWKKRPLITMFSISCLQQNSNYQYEKASKDFGYKIKSLDITLNNLVNYIKENNYLDK